MSEYVATFRPSGAHGWMRCAQWESSPGSSIWADEGTMLHGVVERCLCKPGDAVEVGADLTAEQQQAVQFCVDHVRAVPGEHRWYEQSWSLTPITGEGHAQGTCDAALWDPENGVLTVVDYKFGYTPVSAHENPQLMIYAAAIMADVALGDVKRVDLHICQPRLDRVSTWSTDVTRINGFIFEVDRAIDRYGDAPAEPGQAQCKYCAHAGVCQAQTSMVFSNVSDDFVDLNRHDTVQRKVEQAIERIALMDTAQLATAYSVLGLIEDWGAKVKEEVLARLSKGEVVPGYKLVEGRAGNRQWKDEDQALSFLKGAHLHAADVIETKVISPTKAEKLLSVGQRKEMTAFVTRLPGKPAVAKESDKRPAIEPPTTTLFLKED